MGRSPAACRPPAYRFRVLGSQVLLDWDPVPGAQGYLVYRLPQPYQPDGRVLVRGMHRPLLHLAADHGTGILSGQRAPVVSRVLRPW